MTLNFAMHTSAAFEEAAATVVVRNKVRMVRMVRRRRERGVRGG